MRSATVALVAAATAVGAQTTSISFFYPAEQPSYDEYSDIALSIVEVQDADHTVVAFSCLDATTTTSADWPYSTSSDSDSDSDSDSYSDPSYYNNCVFVDGALTATVGPDSFAYTTVMSYNDDYYGTYDYSMTMGCTSAADAAFCTIQSDGADAWSDYCSYSADIDYDDTAALTSCISTHASSTLPAYTSALQASELSAITMPVTAGAGKLSAGAAASATGSASSTSHTSKFTVSASAVNGGATTTIGGPSASGSSSGSAAATVAQQTGNAAAAAGRRVVGGLGGVVGGVVVAALVL
ncbi:mfs myo-inositol protein [Diplodia corticola]|uniref:Mfs myo-inositol protein n=1 Tax=Diplodia corticola TaxID=236234 RepID=A0A1J9QLZ6_9PEZI|nr:mfs myo-inositol protein [Diplodia corticola]OJD29926.1 mfs myo-inositol protein [Diplodia corticola]